MDAKLNNPNIHPCPGMEKRQTVYTAILGKERKKWQLFHVVRGGKERKEEKKGRREEKKGKKEREKEEEKKEG